MRILILAILAFLLPEEEAILSYTANPKQEDIRLYWKDRGGNAYRGSWMATLG